MLVAEQRLVSAGSELTGCSHDTVTARLGERGMTRSTFRPFDPGLRILTPGPGMSWTLLASAWTRAESATSWVAYSGVSVPPSTRSFVVTCTSAVWLGSHGARLCAAPLDGSRIATAAVPPARRPAFMYRHYVIACVAT